ncbi:hypothetical protein [Halalkalibacillus halophilus]|uniref:hypothetical protein n=1 Tax=Halalkalibacillus halophilus TaxID=392827 RepID=UPI000424B74C|nr:hypothetical protein [Halalkalibacillus halophilus]
MFKEGTLEEYYTLIHEGEFRPRTVHERLEMAVHWLLNHRVETLGHLQEHLQDLLDRYITPAAEGYDVRKRMLVLAGPPGSGKSTLVHLLKEALVYISKTEEGAIFQLKECPLHEDPLLALPEKERKELNHAVSLQIEGFLSSKNQLRLKENFQEDWRKLPVERVYLSFEKRIGIGDFHPGDPYNQELNELIGSIDFSSITTYGSSSDPRSYRYDGEFQVANRGIVELHEFFKNIPSFLYVFQSITEERLYKIPKQSNVYPDVLPIAHTNMAELESFLKRPENESLSTRMLFHSIPYNLNVDDEVKYYRMKMKSEDHEKLCFHALNTLAETVIISRLVFHTAEYSIEERLKLYKSGLDEPFGKDGFIGMQPRFVLDVLSECMSKFEIVDANVLLNQLKFRIDSDLRLKSSEKEKYKISIEIARELYYNRIAFEVYQALEEYEYDRWQELLQQIVKKLSAKDLFIDKETTDSFKEERLEEWICSKSIRAESMSMFPDFIQEELRQKIFLSFFHQFQSPEKFLDWVRETFLLEINRNQQITFEMIEDWVYESILK